MKFHLPSGFIVVILTWTCSSLAATTAVDPSGTWNWTVKGRNGQPEETILELKPDAHGSLIGTLTDRGGPHQLNDIALNGVNLTFTVIRETPNGKVPTDYALKLDGKNPKVTIVQADSAPAAKRANKKRHVELDVVRGTSGDKPKN